MELRSGTDKVDFSTAGEMEADSTEVGGTRVWATELPIGPCRLE